MARDRETVDAAAVLKDGKVYSLPQPARHHNVLHAICEQLGLSYIGKHEQGFVTSTGRFVTRYQAARIAFRAGQTKELIRRVFTSEDLW